jgi:hypothetical protein
MASFNQKGPDDRKISGMTDVSAPYAGATDGGEGKGGSTRSGNKSLPGSRKKKGWVAILLDILLLLTLAALIVGGWFGYRALRDVYAPEWEVREVIYRVELKGIDPNVVEYGEDGRPVYTNKALWSSDRTDADHLGTVVDVQTDLVSSAGGTNTLNLYLTVKANAYYREGKGYRMGATMLLAGYEGLFRLEGAAGDLVDGLMAKGMILSLHEVADETVDTNEETTARPESDETAPEAQG